MTTTGVLAAALGGISVFVVIEAAAIWRCIRRQHVIRAQVARTLAAIEQYTRDRSWG